jgi:hypothetical protein
VFRPRADACEIVDKRTLSALVALAIAGLDPVMAGEKPSTWFCMKAIPTDPGGGRSGARPRRNKRDDSESEEVLAVI